MIPAEKSYPMQLIKKAPLLEQKITNRYYADSIRNFIDEMQKLGCSNQEIVSLKSILLSTE
jgi:DNA-binding transcriptional regulator YhcF (GntR family)